MTQVFSLSLRYRPLRTGNLDRAREFYEKLLGLPACGEQPGDFVQPGRGIARVGHRGCRAYTGRMSAMREELHHLVDLLPEAELRPALELIRAHAAGEHGPERDLPFFASFEADPDLAERAEEILASELGR